MRFKEAPTIYDNFRQRTEQNDRLSSKRQKCAQI